MHFRQMVAYHGPNRSSGVPTLEVWLELGSQHAWRSSTDPRAIQRLLTWLPALDDPPQEAPTELADGVRTESFHKAAERGLTLAAVLEQVARVLMTAAGTPPKFSHCFADDQPGVFRLTIQFEEERLCRTCLEVARQCVLAAVNDEPFDAPMEFQKLEDLADDVRLGPSTRAILHAAAARGIPFRRLTTSGSLVQLGEGRLQHRIWTAETDETSSIGEDIAQDKQLTKSLLWSVGVPVPEGRVVYTSEEAWNAAQEIGFPVVVKPQDANHGRGISFDLTNREELNEAFDLALCENRNANKGVIVEQFAFGRAHRLLVVGDRLIAAARGEMDAVVGDGKSTIAELVEEANCDPRRGENYSHPLEPIYLSELTFLELKKQGLNTQSIPEAGRVVTMRVNGDLTTDETSEVHPAVAEKAVLAAQTVGLNIAGLDVIAEDIGRPLEEQGGMIIEVNAGPGLSMHVEPLYGQPQPVGDAIVELMFPSGEDGRIPIVGVSGGRQSAEIAQLIAALLRKLQRRVGLAVGPQVTVDGQRPYVMKSSSRDRIHSLLLHPDVEAAVFEADPTEALAVGLGCERCDVAVVSAIDSASASAVISLSADGVLPLVRAVPPEGAAILPSESPHVELWISACRGHVVLCSLAGETLRLSDHQARGGRVAFFLKDSLVLATGPNAFFLSLKGVDKKSPTAREHLLPAVAAAWSIGVPVELLRDLLGRTGLNG